MNEILNEAFSFDCPYGTAGLWWLGQMGLLVKLGKTLLCVDYYASYSERRQVAVPIPAMVLEGVDAILGTHNHSDHIDHPSWRIWAKSCPKARFVFPAAHTQGVLNDSVPAERIMGINDSESVEIGDVILTAIAAAHEFLDRDEVSGLYPCLQYIIRGNGVTIWHAGDTLRYEGMLPRIKSFGRIDAALLPINGRDGERYRRNCIGNMTFQEAADLAGEVRPNTVLPGHWDMFANNPGDPYAFKDYIEAKYGDAVPCVIPEVGKLICVTSK